MVVFIVLTALFAMTCPSPIIENNSSSCKPAPVTTLCACTFLSKFVPRYRDGNYACAHCVGGLAPRRGSRAALRFHWTMTARP